MDSPGPSNVLTVRHTNNRIFFKDIGDFTDMQAKSKAFLNDGSIIEDIDDGDDDDEPHQLTRKPSNLNRKAKLQYQEKILKHKRDISEKDKVVPGAANIAASNNLPRNINLYTNEAQGVYGVYATQPDDSFIDPNESLKMKPPTTHKALSGASLVNRKIKSSNRHNPKHFTSVDTSDNVVNGLRLRHVTKDFSKDYSSSSEDPDFEIPDEPPLSSPRTSATGSPTTKSLMKSIFHNKEPSTSRPKSVDFADEIDTNDMMIAPMSDNSSENDEEENEEEADVVDFSMFNLLEKTSKKFCMNPATMGLTIRCQIFRQKGMYPYYKMYLENLDGNFMLILTARKKKRTKTTVYQINYISFNTINDVQQYIETPIAKLKSNLLGTNFCLYDFGAKPPVSAKKIQTKIGKENPASTAGDESEENKQNNQRDDPNNDEDNTYTNNDNSESINPSMASTNNTESFLNYENSIEKRKEYVSVGYQFNLLGIKGPRQMCVVIPGMDDKYIRDDYTLKDENDSLMSAWKKIETNLKINNQQAMRTKTATMSKLQTFRRSLFQLGPGYYKGKSTDDLTKIPSNKKLEIEENVVKLINKQPSYNRDLRSFALNFRGRVTQASVKNFQIVHEINTDYIVMQFGKVNKDVYTCDFSYPLCALQAFGIAVTSLDNKLGCD